MIVIDPCGFVNSIDRLSKLSVIESLSTSISILKLCERLFV